MHKGDIARCINVERISKTAILGHLARQCRTHHSWVVDLVFVRDDAIIKVICVYSIGAYVVAATLTRKILEQE